MGRLGNALDWQGFLLPFKYNCKFATPSIFDDPLYSRTNDGPHAGNARRVSYLVLLMICLCITVTIHIYVVMCILSCRRKAPLIQISPILTGEASDISFNFIKRQDFFCGTMKSIQTSYGLMKDHLQETVKPSPILYPLPKELEIMPPSHRNHFKKGQESMMLRQSAPNSTLRAVIVCEPHERTSENPQETKMPLGRFLDNVSTLEMYFYVGGKNSP